MMLINKLLGEKCMMNNLPVKKKVSFIEKVKSFVLNLFNIKKDNIIEEDKQTPIIKEIKTNNLG